MSSPDEIVWFILRDGQRVGPLTAEEFAQFDETNRLRPTDQVWHAGMPGWIAYRDYAMREAAARFANPARPSSSARTIRPHALANALQGALRRVSRRLAGLRTVFIRTRDEDGAAARTPNLAQLSPDLPISVQSTDENFLQPSQRRPNLTSAPAIPVHITERLQRPSPMPPLDSEEIGAGLPWLATKLVQGDGAEIRGLGEPRKQDENHRPVADASDETSEPRAEPVLCSLPIPRLANEAKAAAHIGLEIAMFRAWVADGRLPRALPHCDKYDLKAIHLAIDRMSRIGSPERVP